MTWDAAERAATGDRKWQGEQEHAVRRVTNRICILEGSEDELMWIFQMNKRQKCTFFNTFLAALKLQLEVKCWQIECGRFTDVCFYRRKMQKGKKIGCRRQRERVDMSSGSQKSCSQVRRRRRGGSCWVECCTSGGRGVRDREGGGCWLWSVWLKCGGRRFALEGRNEGGADKAWLPQEHTLTAGPLQIETSPRCPPSSRSLDLNILGLLDELLSWRPPLKLTV